LSEAVKKSYGQIIKSSALIGGSSAINMFMGIVRTKALALLLGPAGVGLLGIYGSIIDLTRTLAGLGINSSGVRQIAEAVGTGDSQRISRTVVTLRRVAFYSGAIGALLLLLLSKPVSSLTFGSSGHAEAVALLALAAFFMDVSAGQGALIQGMRRIADLARMSVLGGLYGTVFSIAIVYFWRDERGIVLSLVCVAIASVFTSWWYARKIKVERVRTTARELRDEVSALLHLGVVFMASSLMTMGSAYLVRLVVVREISTEAAGFYQAAWALGGLYVGFILQSLGADFYPRLTAVAHDNAECNRLVNEQAEVGILMAGPGILATLTFSPLIITLFYSAKFAPATDILRWLCLGMILRTVSWPMGFIIVARGERKIFFWTEVLVNAGYAALVWVGIKSFGLVGTGIAFFGLYAVHFGVVYVIVRRLSGFRWSATNVRLAAIFVPLVAVVFCGWFRLPTWAAVALGAAVTIPAGVFSLRALCTLVPAQQLPHLARKALRLLRLIPSTEASQC
jgi:PST family polysaccharide transporter